MALIDDKNAYKKNIYNEYLDDYNYRVLVRLDENNTMQLPHTRENICALEYAIDNATNIDSGYIMLEGNNISLGLAENLVNLGKKINVEIYEHLWEKYAEIETAAEPNKVVWEYDISKEYSI